MTRRLPDVVFLLALGWLLSVPAVGHACVSDAECDNHDVCSVPDTCVSGTCQLGGGGDTNDDLVCDAELDPNTTINLTHLALRRNNRVRSDVSGSKGAGDLFTSGSPAEAFTGASGVSIRVNDTLAGVPPAGDGVNATVTFLPTECVLKLVGSTSCRTGDGRAFARFKPNKLVAGQYRFSYKLRGLGLTGPFLGPVRIVLTHSGNKHVPDTIANCGPTSSGLRCREF